VHPLADQLAKVRYWRKAELGPGVQADKYGDCELQRFRIGPASNNLKPVFHSLNTIVGATHVPNATMKLSRSIVLKRKRAAALDFRTRR
jgi:hypothetical protein